MKEYIDHDLEVLVQRIYGYKLVKYQIEDKIEYLQKFIRQKDEEIEEKVEVPESTMMNDEQPSADDSFNTTICLSDSDDDDDMIGNEIKHSKIVVNVATKPQPPQESESSKLKKDFIQKRLIAISNRNPISERTALMISLRTKVKETANENYCKASKIKREDLSIRLQISDKCRQLIELLKLQEERKDSLNDKLIQMKRMETKAKFMKYVSFHQFQIFIN